jgi:acetolactate synthase-1/2/3 large subunit
MNGAESLVETLLRSGVDTCFANPGTSEMHFVAALDRIPGMRCVLGLAEGVVTGCADGYARMAEKPACTLLHCGPGLANGLANLHNARRAQTPVVNIVGDQATYHRPLDAPLTAETEGWARGVSAWVRTATSAATVGADAAAAVQAAMLHPGQIATLILPADTAWNEGGVIAEKLPAPARPLAAPHVVGEVAGVLRGGEPAVLVLAGAALRPAALQAAHSIARATGAALLAQQSNARMARGRGRVPIERVPYVVEAATAALSRFRHVVLGGQARGVLRLSRQARLSVSARRAGACADAGRAGPRRCARPPRRGGRRAAGPGARCRPAPRTRARRADARGGGADAGRADARQRHRHR